MTQINKQTASELQELAANIAHKNEVLKDIKQNNLTATIAKLEMLKDASYLLKNDNYRSWYYYCNAKYYQKLKDTSTANSNFRKLMLPGLLTIALRQQKPWLTTIFINPTDH